MGGMRISRSLGADQLIATGHERPALLETP